MRVFRTTDYGDPDKEEDFKFIYEYVSSQNVFRVRFVVDGG